MKLHKLYFEITTYKKIQYLLQRVKTNKSVISSLKITHVKISIFTLLLIMMTSCFHPEKEEPLIGCGVKSVEESKKQEPLVFTKNCSSCHLFEKNATGPKLEGILSRVPSKEWLQTFIRNQDSLIQISDSTTLQKMSWSSVEFNHRYSNLDENQWNELIDFITL